MRYTFYINTYILYENTITVVNLDVRPVAKTF